MQNISAPKNVVLTGIPRSGTTLTCHLLNKLSDTVALHEPLIPLDLRELDGFGLVEYVANYFQEQRRQILQQGTATSKSFGGQVPDNPLAGIDPLTGKRFRVLNGRMITIDKTLSEDFCLVIKQPAFFTAILENLVAANYFNCFAVIRNPLSVLLSWNTVEMPVAQGRVPAAEAFDGQLRQNLDNIPDLYDRQVFLLNWFLQKYIDHLPRENIIFYEQTIQSGGESLKCIQPSAQFLSESLSSKNTNALYNQELKEMLKSKLLKTKEGAFWEFYSKADLV
ncbi:MAG: hypothetical protein E6Q58_02615 [Niabella sp.]|nr:MAG: hypothetical protein E6Q58_02615 [Niabella sp.]